MQQRQDHWLRQTFRRSRVRGWWFGMALVVGLVAGCQPASVAPAVGANTPTAPAPLAATEATPVRVAQSEEARDVFAQAVVEPVYYAAMSAPREGQVEAILVNVGDRVTAGTPLVNFAAADAQLALDRARAELQAAEAALAREEQRLLQAETEVAIAQEAVRAAEAQLALAAAGPRPEEIAAAEAELAAAEGYVTQAAGVQQAALSQSSDALVQAAEAELASAQASRVVAEERYNTVLFCLGLPAGDPGCPISGFREEVARAELNAARAAEQAAIATLEQRQSGVSFGQSAAASGDVVVAAANRDVAQASLDLLLAGPSPSVVALYAADLEQARAAEQIAVALVDEARAVVAQAEAAVVQATASVASAQLTVDQLRLVAPFDGTIAGIDVFVGETVLRQDIVLTIADLSSWQVRTTDLSELDVSAVTLGQTLDVRVDALGNRSFEGVVSEIGVVPRLDAAQVVYDVVLRVAAIEAFPVRWGMTATVSSR